MHICEFWPTQNTSRQQAVTPRLGGAFFKVAVVCDVNGEVFLTEDWDCNRTRTTSKGVTESELEHLFEPKRGVDCTPKRPVKMLPQVADTIFCMIEASPAGLASAVDADPVPEVAAMSVFSAAQFHVSAKWPSESTWVRLFERYRSQEVP